jgi:hypothetical protein
LAAGPASLAGGHSWSLPGSLAAAVVASVGCAGVAAFALAVAVTPDARTPGRPYWLLLGASTLILWLLEVAAAVVYVWAQAAGAAWGGGG